MSVSVYVSGIRNKTKHLDDMITLKMQCDWLNVSYPKELIDYFAGTDVLGKHDSYEAIEEALEVDLKHDLAITEGDVESGNGMTIDLSKLPDDIIKLRIYMS